MQAPVVPLDSMRSHTTALKSSLVAFTGVERISSGVLVRNGSATHASLATANGVQLQLQLRTTARAPQQQWPRQQYTLC